MGKLGDYKIVKHERWDAAEAKYHYWWTLHTYRKPRFRKLGWYPVKDYYYDSMGGTKDPVRYYSAIQVKAAASHYRIDQVQL